MEAKEIRRWCTTASRGLHEFSLWESSEGFLLAHTYPSGFLYGGNRTTDILLYEHSQEVGSSGEGAAETLQRLGFSTCSL